MAELGERLNVEVQREKVPRGWPECRLCVCVLTGMSFRERRNIGGGTGVQGKEMR